MMFSYQGCWFPFLLFLVVLVPSHAGRPCEIGSERYDSFVGKCIPCRCQAGQEKDSFKEIIVDDKYGALDCPACKPCQNGSYSNAETQFTCVVCSSNCRYEGRSTKVPCDLTKNRECGDCLRGFYEILPELQLPCMKCPPESSHRKECKDYHVISSTRSVGEQHDPGTDRTTVDAQDLATNGRKLNTSTLDNDHNSKSELIVTILCLVVIIVAIAMVFGVMKMYNCCQRIRSTRHDCEYQSVTTMSSVFQMLKIPANNTNDIEIDSGRIDMEDIMKKMEAIQLKRSGPHIRLVSTKIDKDPGKLFDELNIGKSVIHQETENYKCDVCERYIQILNRWVSQKGPDIKLSVLYNALKKYGFNDVCDLIIKKVSEEIESV